MHVLIVQLVVAEPVGLSQSPFQSIPGLLGDAARGRVLNGVQETDPLEGERGERPAR